MSNVIKLASARERPVIKACGTCKHMRSSNPMFQKCAAVGDYTSTVRLGECRDGAIWEPKPEWPGFFRAMRRFFLGGA